MQTENTLKQNFECLTNLIISIRLNASALMAVEDKREELIDMCPDVKDLLDTTLDNLAMFATEAERYALLFVQPQIDALSAKDSNGGV